MLLADAIIATELERLPTIRIVVVQMKFEEIDRDISDA
jgi:hypothetical protein